MEFDCRTEASEIGVGYAADCGPIAEHGPVLEPADSAPGPRSRVNPERHSAARRGRHAMATDRTIRRLVRCSDPSATLLGAFMADNEG